MFSLVYWFSLNQVNSSCTANINTRNLESYNPVSGLHVSAKSCMHLAALFSISALAFTT